MQIKSAGHVVNLKFHLHRGMKISQDTKYYFKCNYNIILTIGLIIIIINTHVTACQVTNNGYCVQHIKV